MDWRYAIGGGGLVLFALTLWWAGPAPADGAAQAERRAVLERIERSDHAEHPPHDVDPARRLPDHPLSGVEREDVSEYPPLNDAEAWRQERAKQAQILHEGQVAATRTFAAEQGLDAAQTEAIAAAVDGLHAELRRVKQQVELGELPAAELRKRTPELRDQATRAVRAAIGPMATAALKQHLADDALGGGF